MREFLKGLDLGKEVIDSIMVEVGKRISSEKEKQTELEKEVADYKQEIENYKTQVNDLNKNIENKDKSLQELQTLTDENKNLKAQVQMSTSNVKKEFSKFVTSEVMSQVNDDTDFATALDNYKKDNPQYFGDTVVKKVQSGPTLNGGGTQPKTTNDIMNNILRGATNNNE